MSYVNDFEIKQRITYDIIEKLEDIIHRNIITQYGREDYADAHFAGACEVKSYIQELIDELKEEFSPIPTLDTELTELEAEELNQLIKNLQERTANAEMPW